MTPRSLTEPLTSRTMWRKLLQRVHPSHGGDARLYAWTRSLFEYIVGDSPEDARTTYQRREPPQHPTAGERLDFEGATQKYGSFEELTARAVATSERVGDPYGALLLMLRTCYPAQDGPLMRAQNQGASYKQLAYSAHLAGMTGAQRTRWYRIAENIPLSQRHIGHIIAGLQEERGA